MKKSIFVLLVLLAILIVTCVYQKTYEIYSTSPKEITLIERKPTTQSTATTATVEKKEEKTTIPAVTPAPVPTKPIAIKPAPVVKAESAVKKEAKVKVVETEKAVAKEVKKEAVQSTENSAPADKVPVVMTEKATTPKSVAIQKSTSDTANKPAPTTEKSGEEEIVDYVMWAMKNRDIAMKNRDQVVARIQELITKAINDRKVALDERKVVLDERSKNEVELEKLQTEQIDARDASYESVTNPKTTNQGEK